MTIYFTGSFTGKEKNLSNYNRIVKYLESKGHKVISDHIIKVEEKEVQYEKREERLAFHDQLEKWLNTCDFMIAETTFPSISVGFEISLALHRGKPVLILYNNNEPPTLLAHHKNENLVCEHYTDDTLAQVIEEFISYVEGAEDTRFTFFITPKIANYLDDVSRKEKMPKSVYLRKLIEKDMDK
jgi:nucleoside 2-deoxyribosyltransferase